MVMDLSEIGYYAPMLIFLIAGILTFVVLKKLSIGNTAVNLFLSLFVALIFTTSTRGSNYLTKVIPALTTLMIVGFFILVVLAFFSKDIFLKPLTWIGFIMALIIVVVIAFQAFPSFYHMLPGTSNAYLDSAAVNTKEFLWDRNTVDSIIFIVITALVGLFIIKK